MVTEEKKKIVLDEMVKAVGLLCEGVGSQHGVFIAAELSVQVLDKEPVGWRKDKTD